MARPIYLKLGIQITSNPQVMLPYFQNFDVIQIGRLAAIFVREKTLLIHELYILYISGLFSETGLPIGSKYGKQLDLVIQWIAM